MGTLTLLAALLLAPAAHAQDLDAWVIPVHGPPTPGQTATVQIGLAGPDGTPLEGVVPLVEPSAGEIIPPLQPVAPGRWEAAWRIPADVTTTSPLGARVVIGTRAAAVTMPLAAPEASALRLPERIEGSAGQTAPLRLLVSGDALPDPDELQVTLSSGRLAGIEATDEGLLLSVLPPTDPLPRVIAVGVRDGRQPGPPPAWTILRLSGRPRIPIQTDPGAEVSMELAGRRYGPFEAGPDGVATLEAQVWPGERTAVIIARDAPGNESRTELDLGGMSDPLLLMTAESGVVPGHPLPDLHLAAFRVDGKPWTGPPPTCLTGVGEEVVLAPVATGTWRASLPPTASRMFDVKVECVLDARTRQLLRVPLESAVPETVRLRVWPPVVDADLPVVQVQAWLEGPTGDRLPVEGLDIQAGLGKLELEPSSPALLVATYDGTAAVDAGEDEIVARWAAPPGSGGAWELDLGLAAVRPDGKLDLVVQARDRLGRPIAGSPVALSLGSDQAEAVTDEDGRVRVSLPASPPAGPWPVTFRSGELERRELVFRTDAGPEALPQAGLESRLVLPVRTGFVRQVFVEARPDEITAGQGATSTIVVQLQDQSGRPIPDAQVRVDASEGKVGRVQPSDDGGYQAEFIPPGRMHYGEVELTVSGDGEWRGSTRVVVLPKQLRYAMGLSAGYLYGARSISSPWVEAELNARIPRMPNPLVARLSVGGYLAEADVEDDGTGQPVQLDLGLLPISLGVLGRTEQGRLSGWIGASLVVAPYRLVAVYGDDVGLRGIGLAPPGGELVGGAGWRLGSGELQLQAAYLLLSLPPADVGWSGPVGGIRGALGWKFLY